VCTAQATPEGFVVPEATASFTVRLPVSVIAAARAGASERRQGLGALTAAALVGHLALESRSRRGAAS
jgi:hypothetical protein